MRSSKFGNSKVLVAASLLGSFLSTTALAQPAGVASISGSVTVIAGFSPSTSASNGVFFFDATGPNDYIAGSTPATVALSYTGLTNGTIQNLLGSPTTGAFPVAKFATFPVTAGTIDFDLVSIRVGTGTPTACGSNVIGNVCTPPNSPFTLTQQGSNGNGNVCDPTNAADLCSVAITLNLDGQAYFSTTPALKSSTFGSFTAQVIAISPGVGATLSGVLGQVATTAGFTTTYSASFMSTPPPPPPPPFTCSVTQGGWGAPPHGNNPGEILAKAFPTTYPLGVTIGEPLPLNSLLFTSAAAVQAFLPQGGPPSSLTSSATNPTGKPSATSAGVFAGQVLALQLNVDIQHMGSVIVSGTGTSLDTKTVAQVLAAANQALAGGSLPAGFASISALNDLVDGLNQKYDTCN